MYRNLYKPWPCTELHPHANLFLPWPLCINDINDIMIAAGYPAPVTHSRSDPYRAPVTAAAAFLQPLKPQWDMDNSNKF